jgi:hypothetical protein
MTPFVVAMLSVIGLTLAAWLVRRASRAEICPVCAGVAGTWLWMIAARAGGFAVDGALLAILMGMSVVGIAQWIAGRLPAGRSPLAWKAFALPSGAAAAYGAATAQWAIAGAAATTFVLAALAFGLTRRNAPADTATLAELEERMKKCC